MSLLPGTGIGGLSDVSRRPKPIVLTVLDGWGYGAETKGNAIALARKLPMRQASASRATNGSRGTPLTYARSDNE